MFGIGTELSEGEWRGVVRQLLASGLLAVKGDYGTLVLTDASAEVLRGQRKVMLRREPARPARPAPRGSPGARPRRDGRRGRPAAGGRAGVRAAARLAGGGGQGAGHAGRT